MTRLAHGATTAIRMLSSHRRSAKAENGEECFVDPPEFLVGQMTDQSAQSSGVYGTDLFNENAGGFAFDLGFGPE